MVTPTCAHVSKVCSIEQGLLSAAQGLLNFSHHVRKTGRSPGRHRLTSGHRMAGHQSAHVDLRGLTGGSRLPLWPGRSGRVLGHRAHVARRGPPTWHTWCLCKGHATHMWDTCAPVGYVRCVCVWHERSDFTGETPHKGNSGAKFLPAHEPKEKARPEKVSNRASRIYRLVCPTEPLAKKVNFS
jgi:hypothetical protein